MTCEFWRHLRYVRWQEANMLRALARAGRSTVVAFPSCVEHLATFNPDSREEMRYVRPGECAGCAGAGCTLCDPVRRQRATELKRKARAAA